MNYKNILIVAEGTCQDGTLEKAFTLAKEIIGICGMDCFYVLKLIKCQIFYEKIQNLSRFLLKIKAFSGKIIYT